MMSNNQRMGFGGREDVREKEQAAEEKASEAGRLSNLFNSSKTQPEERYVASA